LEHYPRQAQDQYRWIAGPVNCKEDAIQVLLDLTPGKKTLLTQKLTTDEEERLTGKKAAGILVVWNRAEEKGRGIVLGFDWAKAPEKNKLRKLLNMLPYVESPDQFVGVIKEFDVTLPIMEELTRDRSNPYEWLGLMK
jgi:formylmethanofuran dehydrogenase subunit E-like metal-binding protein